MGRSSSGLRVSEGRAWRPEGGDESRRRGSLEAAVLGRIRIRYSPRSSLRSLASFPPSIHQAANLECHLAGGRSRHLSLSTCRWHIDARRPLVPSSDPPFSPPPRPPAKLRPTISTANIIQQNHSSSRRHWSALGAGRQPIYLPKDDVSFFGSYYRMDGDGTRSGGR